MWPSDLDFGMFGYEFDGKASGGKIKQKAEDFKVIEVDPNSNSPIEFPPERLSYKRDDGGLFLMGRVWRKDMDHAKMVRELAKTFKVPEENISTAGIKDANAEIVQLFSVFQPRRDVEDPTIIDIGLEIDSFQFIREKIYPGSMGGNYFDIVIRNVNDFDQHNLSDFIKWAKNGMLNYYGYQRFGSYRPITAEFGRALARKDYKNAVDTYLGGKSSASDEEYRKHWRENRDPGELLLIWDGIPQIERSMLQYLSKRPNNYQGALSKVPTFLHNIAYSAFISLLTNHYLSRRGLEFQPLSGERFYNDNIEIALPSNRWKKPLNDIWAEVFSSMDIDMKKDFKEIRHTTRELRLLPKNMEGLVENNQLRIMFQLSNGQYATTVLRQLMQGPPSAYF